MRVCIHRPQGRTIVAASVLLGICLHVSAAVGGSFVEFESGQVRPVCMSPNGSKLFAVNTPDNRLEVFDIGISPALTHSASIPVGMEPVAVAARSNTEVWVVNHLSDSISIVDLSASPPHVVRTLLVGDEPRDIVFAGPGGNRAFITTAHRGQQRLAISGTLGGGDPQLTTQGVGRADVWVFDATNLGTALGGTPLRILSLFGDTPRALTVSNDGGTVYAAVFHSGNQSTTVSEGAVCDTSPTSYTNNTVEGPCNIDGVSMPGGMPLPHSNGNLQCSVGTATCSTNADCAGPGGACSSGTCTNSGAVGRSCSTDANCGVCTLSRRPEVGLIVKFNGVHWVDRTCPAGSTCSCQGGTNAGGTCTQDSNCPSSVCGRNWDNAVKFTLPDEDVFAINANASPPAQTAFYTHVGTILFNMAVNPVSGKLYVSNGEERNEVRFEGPGVFGGSTVQGHLNEYRISVLDGVNPAVARHLNKHIDYSIRPAPAGVKDNSLSTPTGMAITADGQTLYVAAFGSSKVGVFNTAQLENDTFTPSAASHILLTGGGPSGLALDETHHRLYVLTRFDNGISVVGNTDTTPAEVDHLSLYNPEPASVVNGRQFLYDAYFTSSNGEASCSSCHIFGDMDDLAWDLGNPDDVRIPDPLTIKLKQAAILQGATVDFNSFHPMKGPMTTQTLRGMVNHGTMHWRGDRVNQNGNVYDSDVAFRNFRVAFPGLVGRDSQIPESDMQAFSDFVLQVYLPPNPNRALDNSLTASQAAGKSFMLGLGAGTGHCSVTTANSCALDSDCPTNEKCVGHCSTTTSQSCTFNYECPLPQTCVVRRADGFNVDNPFDTTHPLGFQCVGCHILDAANGHFGGNGDQSFENETQVVKVAHLRNLYQKVGMFGMPAVDFFNAGDNGPKGDQIRGFGFLHDGSTDTVFRFLQATVFDNGFSGTVGFATGAAGTTQRQQVEQFLLGFDTDFAPVVGQQITLTSTNAATVGPRIDLLIARSGTPFVLKGNPTANECDLIVKGTVGGLDRGWYLTPGGTFQSDRASETPLTDAQLRALATTAGQDLTYTCVPPGSGIRAGIDRDEDGYYDRDEIDAGSDPANAASIPSGVPTVTPTPTETDTATDTPTVTPTLTPTTTNTSAAPTATQTATPTVTMTNTPVNTPTATPTNTPTRTRTATPTSTSVNTATITPTVTVTPTVTSTATATAEISCSGGSVIDKGRLVVTNDLDPAGDETLTISGRWQVVTVPRINPIANGFRFAVYDHTGTLLYTRVIPPGLAPSKTAPGWHTNTRVTRWTFRDPTGTLAGGIRTVHVANMSTGTAPNRYTFKAHGKLADFQVQAAEAPAQMTVVLGGQTASDAGQCASLAFNPAAGPTPACKFTKGGKTLSCH